MCSYDPEAVVTSTWTLRVKSYCPTFNTIGLNTKNNFKYRGWRKTWEAEFGDWLKSIPPANRHRRITITRLYGHGKRSFDSQNFAGGCKPLLDTLVKFGALYDDNDMWCSAHYKQCKSPDGIDYIEVQIEELA